MKKYYLLICFGCMWQLVTAQFINDGGNIDRQPYNFGFSLAVNYGSFNVIKSPRYQDQFVYTDVNQQSTTVAPLAAVRAVGKPGFSLGLLANLKLSRNLDLRFTPNIIFIDRDIEYIYQRPVAGDTGPGNTGPGNTDPGSPEPGNNGPGDGGQNLPPVPENRQLNIRFTNLQYPFLLKFKSNRQGNVRAYVIGGVKFCMDVTSRKKYDEAMTNADKFPADIENPVFIDRNYFAWEAGIGLDLYYEFFKCSPEIKLSRSFASVLNNDDNLYSRPLSGLFAELLQFTVHFE